MAFFHFYYGSRIYPNIQKASIPNYVGSCLVFKERLEEHLSKKSNTSFTARANDWELYYKMDGLGYEQARKIETHIKKMKSKKYYENLIKYPEIMGKLIANYH